MNQRPLLSNEALSRSLEALRGRRVTQDYIDSRIKGVAYTQLDGTNVTLCHIELDNGFSVRGESACVDPENFNPDIGQRLAYDDAYHKLWPLFGFLLAEAFYQDPDAARPES